MQLILLTAYHLSRYHIAIGCVSFCIHIVGMQHKVIHIFLRVMMNPSYDAALQVGTWEQCGGLSLKSFAQNAADPSICCPAGNTCTFINEWCAAMRWMHMACCVLHACMKKNSTTSELAVG
jgi:hypothetical protein